MLPECGACTECADCRHHRHSQPSGTSSLIAYGCRPGCCLCGMQSSFDRAAQACPGLCSALLPLSARAIMTGSAATDIGVMHLSARHSRRAAARRMSSGPWLLNPEGPAPAPGASDLRSGRGAACSQVQYHWSNLDAIFTSSCHSGPELERERGAQKEATNQLRTCMAGFKAAPGIEQVTSGVQAPRPPAPARFPWLVPRCP